MTAEHVAGGSGAGSTADWGCVLEKVAVAGSTEGWADVADCEDALGLMVEKNDQLRAELAAEQQKNALCHETLARLEGDLAAARNERDTANEAYRILVKELTQAQGEIERLQADRAEARADSSKWQRLYDEAQQRVIVYEAELAQAQARITELGRVAQAARGAVADSNNSFERMRRSNRLRMQLAALDAAGERTLMSEGSGAGSTADTEMLADPYRGLPAALSVLQNELNKCGLPSEVWAPLARQIKEIRAGVLNFQQTLLREREAVLKDALAALDAARETDG